ncbi:MAG: hypothetical protein ACRDBL_02080, partial [Rhabdaerophilum sp.]
IWACNLGTRFVFRTGDRVMTSRSSLFPGLLRASLPVAALIWAFVPAQAQDLRSQPTHSAWVITKAQLNKTECTCRIQGQSLPVGSEVCMQNSMFRCQMDQNVTTWRPLGSPCPQS